jgi:hypothetical protein
MNSYQIYKKAVITFASLAILWGFIEFSSLFFVCTDSCGMEFIFIVPAITISIIILGIWKLIIRKVSRQQITNDQQDSKSKRIGTVVIIITALVSLALFGHFVVGIF